MYVNGCDFYDIDKEAILSPIPNGSWLYDLM